MSYLLPTFEAMEPIVRQIAKDRGNPAARAWIAMEIEGIIRDTGRRLVRVSKDQMPKDIQFKVLGSDHIDMSDAVELELEYRVATYKVGVDGEAVERLFERLVMLAEQFGEPVVVMRSPYMQLKPGIPTSIPLKQAVPDALKTQPYDWGHTVSGVIHWTDTDMSLNWLADLMVRLMPGGGLNDARRNFILECETFKFLSARSKESICKILYKKLHNKKPKEAPKPNKNAFPDMQIALEVVGGMLQKRDK